MIKIERTSVEFPVKIFKRVQKSKDDLKIFFDIPLGERIQRSPKYDNRFWKEVKNVLFELFHEKCAYCESRFPGDPGDVEMFRPKFGAINLDKTKSPDHYWWLCYEWENLYLSCRECNFAKGSKFPVLGDRGPLEASIKELRELETALLIDPCYDEPDEHLAFADDGGVSPITEKGRITIETLNLNRPRLVYERKHEIENARKFIKFAVKAGEYTSELVEKQLAPNQPYGAARRQSIHRFIREVLPSLKSKINRKEKAETLETVKASSHYISSTRQTKLDKKFSTKQRETESLPISLSAESFYTKTQNIAQIKIRNFRNIEDLTIIFPDVLDNKNPWLILLGENGAGKSSILKAIALTLMAAEKRQELDLDAREFVRREAEEGYVEIQITGYTEPFRLDFNKSDAQFYGNDKVLQTLFFCYGGTRLLPNKQSPPRDLNDYSRVSNLFNPFLPLINASDWLLNIPEAQFGFSARAIKQICTKDDEKILVRVPSVNPTDVMLRSEFLNTSDRLEVLSDGYQSIIALVSDILEIMLKHYDLVDDSEGIILIDEIDVHLHPRWKIEIVSLLRKVFPRVQFIVTTHDPLCLLGSLPGEVHVLRRNQETTMIEAKQVDIPPGTTADQVLTGFWFGLRSTLDDDTLALLDRHRQLLREKTPEDDTERVQLESDLRERLGSFADTSIDRMAQSVAAQIMQEEIGDLTPARRDSMRRNIRQKLSSLIIEKEE